MFDDDVYTFYNMAIENLKAFHTVASDEGNIFNDE